MRPKSETLNFELLVPSKGIFYFRKYGTDKKVSVIDSQLQGSGTVFQPRRMSSYANVHRSSRIGKQYAKMLEDYDTWSQVFDQTFEVLLTSAARLSELSTRRSNSCQGKRLKSVLTIRLLLNSEQSQSDLRGIKRTSIQRQYYLARFSRATQVLYNFQYKKLKVTMVLRYHGNFNIYLRGNFLDGNGIIYFDLNGNGIMQFL